MSAKSADSIPFRKVVVISNEPKHMEHDVATLKHFAVQLMRTFASGAEAFGYLAANKPDLIMCDTLMDDMDSRSFLRMLMKNPGLKVIPVVMVTRDNDRNSVLDAIAAGCSGYILRPYSADTFERHITITKQLTRFSEIEAQQINDAKKMLDQGDFDSAIEEFEEIVSMKDEAKRYYDMGCLYLVKQKFGKAIVAFNKAIKINDLFADAYQGLAEAYKHKGDIEQYKFYLTRAAEIYAEFDRMEEVKTLFIDILKVEKKAPNPFNTLGVKLRKQGDVQAALHAYKQALALTPSDENIHYNMAKAHYLLEDYESALDKVTMCLSLNPDFPEALKMYKEIEGREWPGERPSRAEVDRPMEPKHALKDD